MNNNQITDAVEWLQKNYSYLSKSPTYVDIFKEYASQFTAPASKVEGEKNLIEWLEYRKNHACKRKMESKDDSLDEKYYSGQELAFSMALNEALKASPDPDNNTGINTGQEKYCVCGDPNCKEGKEDAGREHRLKLGQFREWLQQFDKEEISMSKLVELINDHFNIPRVLAPAVPLSEEKERLTARDFITDKYGNFNPAHSADLDWDDILKMMEAYASQSPAVNEAKEKKYTEEDISNAVLYGNMVKKRLLSIREIGEYIQSLK